MESGVNIRRVNRLLEMLIEKIGGSLVERKKKVPELGLGLDLPKFRDIRRIKKKEIEPEEPVELEKIKPSPEEIPDEEVPDEVSTEIPDEVPPEDEKVVEPEKTEKEIEKEREKTFKLVKTKLKSKLGYDSKAKLKKYINSIISTIKEKGFEKDEIYDIISYIIYTMEKDGILPKFPTEDATDDEIFNWLNKAVEENLAGLIINII